MKAHFHSATRVPSRRRLRTPARYFRVSPCFVGTAAPATGMDSATIALLAVVDIGPPQARTVTSGYRCTDEDKGDVLGGLSIGQSQGV